MIKSLKIKPGCISCKSCENICPKVFKVNGVSKIQEGWRNIDEESILNAEKNCPVNVICAEIDNQEPVKKEKKHLKSYIFDKKINILNIFRKILLTFGLFTPFLYFFGDHFFISKGVLWDISWYSVLILMTIRPLSDLFKKNSFLKKLIPFRKELGIISAMVVFSALFQKFIINPEMFFQSYFSIQNFFSNEVKIFARISEITGILLLLTSNTFSQKNLKLNWKKIQLLAYPYFLSGGIYIYLIGVKQTIYCILFVLIITFIAFLKNRGIFGNKK